MTSKDRVGDIVAANSADVLAYLWRRVAVADDAADLLAEALLVVWRKAESIPADDIEARMWMFGIARKVLLTHGRTTRRRSALQDKLRAQLHDAPVLSSEETALDVTAAIGRLSALDQEIIRLTYWDGLSQAQAAGLLGIPEGTLRSRHHRARRTLHTILNSQPSIL